MSKKILRPLIAILAVLVVACVLVFLTPLGDKLRKNSSKEETSAEAAEEVSAIWETPTSTPTPTPEPEPEFEEYDITLMAVGDDLLHMGVINAGVQGDGTYNFDCLFSGIADALEMADIKIINQETIFGGDDRGPSGYPAFNSPTAVGDAIVKAGFNVVLAATNHVADMGVSGMENCYNYWQTQSDSVLLTGLYDGTVPTEPRIPILEVEGFKFAILDYTYSCNMESLPGGFENYFGVLCPWNDSRYLDFTQIRQEVLDEVALAKTMADIVIVCPHWGIEYTTTPTDVEKMMAKALTEAGADLIIGTHPHVPQPVEVVTSDNGNQSLCYYSLGNFVSTQQKEITMLEGMAWVMFHVTEDGISVDIDRSGIIPMVDHYTYGPLRFQQVYYLADYSQEMCNAHGITGWGGVNMSYSNLVNYTNQIFGAFAMEHPTLEGRDTSAITMFASQASGAITNNTVSTPTPTPEPAPAETTEPAPEATEATEAPAEAVVTE